MPKVIKQANPFEGYQRAVAADYDKHRIIGLSVGEVGSRKTSFWLEAPGPIIIYSFDQGLEGTVNRVLNDNPDKEIYVRNYEWYPNKDESDDSQQQRACDIRDEFFVDYEQAITIARTVILDKETNLWNIVRTGEFGVRATDAPKNYDGINARMRRIVNMAKGTDINLGIIQSMKDQWGEKINKKTGAQGAASTGGRIPDGMKEMEQLVHVVLNHSGICPDNWGITVGKVRGPGAQDTAGQTFPNVTFQDFAALMFPESNPEEWL